MLGKLKSQIPQKQNMKTKSSSVKCLAVSFLALAALTSSIPAAHGQAIVSDDFNTGSFHTTIAGRTPDVANLPGGTWSVSNDFSSGGSNNFYAWTNTPGFTTGPNQATSLFLWNGGTGVGSPGGVATVSLNSAGSYTKPSKFSIQSDIQCMSLAGGAQGVMLGFFSSLPPTNNTDPLPGFTGFLVNNVGDLRLVENGVVGTAVAYTGTFDNTLFNTLSYTVNTSTGGISNVTLGGNTAYSFSSSAFTAAETTYAALGMRSTGNNTFGYADNFSVIAVPEPSTYAMLLGGFGMLFGLRRIRCRQS